MDFCSVCIFYRQIRMRIREAQKLVDPTDPNPDVNADTDPNETDRSVPHKMNQQTRHC
jgi:hypothetical protein